MAPRIFAALLAAAELLHAGVGRAQEPATPHVPRRVEVVDRGPNRLLLATGIATLGFSYGVSAWVGATSPRESERFLLAPVVGPWIALAIREECGPRPAVPCDTEPTYDALLVASGALELVGLAQVAFAFVKRERLEIERPIVSPLAFRAGAGLAATATF